MTNNKNIEKHTISILVDNEPGVLARIIGMFSARGYNIESLNASTVTNENELELSRITLVTKGASNIIEQIKSQLGRIVPVHTVTDLTVQSPVLEREIALVKIAGDENVRNHALEIAEDFHAIPVDLKDGAIIFEVTGKFIKIEEFIKLMKPFGLLEIARTGVVALEKGRGTINN